MKTDILISDIEKYAELEGQAILIGDDQVCKKAKEKLHKLMIEIRGDRSLANHVVDKLFLSRKPNVRFWGCDMALNSNYNVEKAHSILEEIIATPRIGILGIRAELYLKRIKNR
ncbi:MAG: hypothetical protein ACRC2K_04615 [Clostridium sp.]